MTYADLAKPRNNEALKDILLGRIRGDGPISFAGFMEITLYHPRLGYYIAGDPSLDFQTSPQVHPVFGAMIGRCLADMWRLMDRPSHFEAFEAGPGSGGLAADVLRWAEATEPEFAAALVYSVNDVAFASREGRERLELLGPISDRLRVRQGFPVHPEIEGCILSNELLDALPFHRVQLREGRLEELNVGAEGRTLVDVPVPATEEIGVYFRTLGLAPGEGCQAEVNLEAPLLIRRAAKALQRGYLLTFDYGHPASQLYAPWRKRGTLLTFYRMAGGDDPFSRIGLQDITASIDFTTVIATAETAGLHTLALTTQEEFLGNVGVGEVLAEPNPRAMEGFFDVRRAVLTLSDPSGLGRIKVLLQSKGVPVRAPRGFGMRRVTAGGEAGKL